jgi:hypothetical protein
MKKIILAAAIIFTSGILTSCNKTSPAQTEASSVQVTSFSFQKNLASGD